MSLCSRIANVFRADRPTREIDEELQSHIAEAIAEGRTDQAGRLHSISKERRQTSGAADQGGNDYCAHRELESPHAGLDYAPRSAPLSTWIPRHQSAHAAGTHRCADRPREAAGDAGALLRGGRVAARRYRPLWRAELLRHSAEAG